MRKREPHNFARCTDPVELAGEIDCGEDSVAQFKAVREKTRRQTTQFSGDSDWVFGSPVKLGRLPISYPWVWKEFQRAGTEAGIGKLGTHSLRHSYRSWLDAVGTAIAVQQKLMRHSDIRTTLKF